jgi:ATP-binding cassette subfamily G (WHITE) protein 2 (PDR)
MSEVLPRGEDKEKKFTGISSHCTWNTKEETLQYQLEQHEQPQSDSQSETFDSTTWFKSLASRCENNRIPSEKRLGVSFRDLQVYAFVPRIKYFLTFATAPGLLLGLFDKLIGRKTAERVEILRGLDGLVRSGEMLLVLGRPGSGCSTFLKVLAGEKKGLSLDPKSVINYEGESSCGTS